MTKKAQVMVSTIFLLMIISLTVIGITVSVSRNSQQVSNNLEYERAYNYAESKIIQYSTQISDPNFDPSELELNNPLRNNCEQSTETTSGEYICTFDEDSGYRTILRIFDVNYLENYELGVEEYFDIILENNNNNNTIELEWTGKTALDLELVYQEQNQLNSVHSIIDSESSVFNQNVKAGFLKSSGLSGDNSARIDLSASNLNLKNPGIKTKLKYLRIRVINKQVGSNISIFPSTNSEVFPDQVRRVEALSYNPESSNSAAPVIVTQFPLSPTVPSLLTNAGNFKAIIYPYCGNGIIENDEFCDSNYIKGLEKKCPDNCECPAEYKSLTFNNCDSRCCQQDGVITYSQRNESFLCLRKNQQSLSVSGKLDDILLLIRPEDSIQISGNIVRFPEPYIMFFNSSGQIDGALKQFKVGNNPVAIRCSYENPCIARDFAASGFKVVNFNKPLDRKMLIKNGFITGDFDNGGVKTNLKFVHLAAGCGHARDIVITPI